MERLELFNKDMYIIDKKLLAAKNTYIIKDKNMRELGKAVRQLIVIDKEERGHREKPNSNA